MTSPPDLKPDVKPRPNQLRAAFGSGAARRFALGACAVRGDEPHGPRCRRRMAGTLPEARMRVAEYLRDRMCTAPSVELDPAELA